MTLFAVSQPRGDIAPVKLPFTIRTRPGDADP